MNAKLAAPIATTDHSTIRTVLSAERKVIELAATAAFYNRAADDDEAVDLLALLDGIATVTDETFDIIMDRLQVRIDKHLARMVREGKAVEARIARGN